MRDISSLLPDPSDTRPLSIRPESHMRAAPWTLRTGNTAGYIYLFRYKEFYKIGYATDVQARLGQLNCAYPDEDGELIHSFYTKNMRASEAQLHRRYAVYHKRKEWFTLDQAAVDEIVAISTI